MNILDKRLNAYRDDLADARLEGRVEARRYVTGSPMRVVSPVADLLSAPARGAGVNTQLLLGASVVVFETGAEYAWVQAVQDGYVGYVDVGALGTPDPEPTHAVAAPRTFLYREADMKKGTTAALSLGSFVTVVGEAETRGTRYALLATGGAVVTNHLRLAGEPVADWVSVAESLQRTPYLWGGASAFGIDCSGLVQLAMREAGRAAPRDSDMQASGLGTQIDPGEDLDGLERGDLVFWKGHVAIMTNGTDILHANGHTMMTSREPLAEAIARIGYLYGLPTGFRRP